MAEVITRFKLETTQYDSKLRDASKSLSEYAKVSSFAGKEFDKFTKDNVEAARALGSIQTSANNAKDKLKELVTAFNTAAKAYNLLTKEQQQSDWGKALAESVQKLQARVTEAKHELYDLSASAKDSGGFIGQLRDKLTVNIDAMKLFGMAVQGAKAALEVIKDAFFASEQNLDDWNRMVYSSKSVYEGFLTAINTGDISGYLSRIDQIVSAANDAYNAIDRLQTTKNIQTPRMQAKMSEVQRMETMLRTGKYIAPVDGRKGTLAEGAILTDAQKKVIADNLASAMSEIAAMTKTEVQRSTDAINALYKEQALQLGMSNEEFRKGTATVAAFEANLEKARKYQEWEAQHTVTTIDPATGGANLIRTGGANPYAAYKGWSVFKDDGNLYQELLSQIRARTSAESQYYGQVGRAYRGINRAEGANTGKNSGNTSTQTEVYAEDSIRAQEKLVADLTQKWNTCAAALRDGYKAQLDEAQKTLNEMRNPTEQELFPNLDVTEESMTLGEKFMDGVMAGIAAHNQDVDTKTLTTLIEVAAKNGIDQAVIPTDELMEKIFGDGADIPDKVWQDLEQKINAELAKLNIKPIKLNLETGALTTITETTKEISKGWNTAAKSAKLFGSAMSAIENPSAKVASIIAETVASIAMAYAQTLAKDKTSKSNIFSFIAASTAAMISMTTSIAAVKKATAGSYADGGVIPGNSYSGDNQWAQVNAGEVILTRAQAGSLASQLENSEGSSQPHNSYISGEQIVTVVNAYGRRTGRGEILR
jgi:hypothetical protein